MYQRLSWCLRMQVNPVQLTRLALSIVREACRKGVPVYAEIKAPGILYVETRRDSDEYVVFTLINPLSEEDTSLAMGKPWDFVTIARVRVNNGNIEPIAVYVEQVPYALATNPKVMPDYEADTWSQRLRLLPRMKPCSERDKSVLCSGENPCVKAIIDEYGVRAWIDECVGIREDVVPWQERMGLRPRHQTRPSL